MVANSYNQQENIVDNHRIAKYFKDNVKEVSGFNELTFVMDYGESEWVLLYKELNADYLLIDDKKQRTLQKILG